MFEFLHIKNFQSHRDTTLEFVPGVNVIFGTSLNGKTAIARAMGLAIYNRPSGAKYFSNFASDKGETIIELKPVETNVITIKKEVKRNADKSKELKSTIYQYNNEEFTGVSKDVPDVIRKAFNISELNIQRQFDSPFLILSSAGEFARVINRVTKLERVDDWVSNFKKRINKTKNEVELLEGQAKTDEIELSKYVDFEDLEKETLNLQKVSVSLDKSEQRFSRIDSLLEKIELINDNLDKINPALLIEKDILVLIDLESGIILAERRLYLIEKAKAVIDTINSLQLVLGELTAIEAVSVLEEKKDRLDKSLQRIQKLEDSIDDLKILGKELTSLEEIIEQEDEFVKLDNYLFKIKNINNYVDSQNILYNAFEEDLLEELKNTKECPLFQVPCLCVNEMMEKIK